MSLHVCMHKTKSYQNINQTHFVFLEPAKKFMWAQAHVMIESAQLLFGKNLNKGLDIMYC